MLIALGLEIDDETKRRALVAVLAFFGTTALSFVVGHWWGRYRARKEWGTKQFLGRIIVSLNSFADDWLKIRTVFERSLEEVFLNPVAVGKVRAASLQTTASDPILPIGKEDRWYILNYVLNAVAERFCDGVVRYDAGQPLRPVTYCLFLTCEVLGEDRIRKVRAMLIREEHLRTFPYAEGEPRLEQAWHRDRVATLRKAAEVYRTDPDQFLKLEVYV
jgi:hypothetical protein